VNLPDERQATAMNAIGEIIHRLNDQEIKLLAPPAAPRSGTRSVGLRI
jgi:hypothetical protein